MEIPLLNDPLIEPDEMLLQHVLGTSFKAYSELLNSCSDSEFGFISEWQYYNDGHAWLCKVTFKKKTIFWISIWDRYFRVVFYFTAKHLDGINELNINQQLKNDFLNGKAIGKLLPFIVQVENTNHIDDILKLATFKKKLK